MPAPDDEHSVAVPSGIARPQIDPSRVDASKVDAASDRPRIDSGVRGAGLRSAFLRYVLLGCGVIFLIVGAIGMVVPMMPGTIFLILAAWCFARSSPRFESWLLTNRYLGPSVARWRETGAIPLPVKLLALSSFVGSFAAAWYAGAPTLVLIFLGALFTVLAIFMVTRPNG